MVRSQSSGLPIVKLANMVPLGTRNRIFHANSHVGIFMRKFKSNCLTTKSKVSADTQYLDVPLVVSNPKTPYNSTTRTYHVLSDCESH